MALYVCYKTTDTHNKYKLRELLDMIQYFNRFITNKQTGTRIIFS